MSEKKKVEATHAAEGSRLEAALLSLTDVAKEAAIRSARAEERSAKAEERSAEALARIAAADERSARAEELAVAALATASEALQALVKLANRSETRLDALERKAS